LKVLKELGDRLAANDNAVGGAVDDKSVDAKRKTFQLKRFLVIKMMI
jgi:hypothetical protein